jgi:methyltransferase (TIGR00027 family)
MTDPLIRDVSDTARWMAVYRARETARDDAAFRDPFAARLAGDRGVEIAAAMRAAEEHSWSFIARTWLFDRFVTQAVNAGVDLVVNLAAGLDARPYRMALPASLRWVEVDLPEILDYKEEMLAHETPVCALERVRLDLSNADARRGLFARLGKGAENAIVLAEGLTVYLMRDEVASLAGDLSAQVSFRHWVLDLCSPGLLAMLRDRMGAALADAGAPLLFAPAEGPPFFEPYGWKVEEVRSILKAAAKLERLPLMLRMLAMLPESNGAQGDRPWSGVCLLSASRGL